MTGIELIELRILEELADSKAIDAKWDAHREEARCNVGYPDDPCFECEAFRETLKYGAGVAHGLSLARRMIVGEGVPFTIKDSTGRPLSDLGIST